MSYSEIRRHLYVESTSTQEKITIFKENCPLDVLNGNRMEPHDLFYLFTAEILKAKIYRPGRSVVE